MVKPTKSWTLAAALVIGATFAGGPARAEMASGAVLANTCFSCHGTDGKSVGAMPTIAGKTAGFIAEKLKAFKSGQLEATVMNRIAKGFSDAEIEALAKFFSGM
ncbi:MAG: c-type cytochrome [Kiloniellales bacterium]